MGARTGSRWWWTMAILPAMAVSACGGTRLTHDAILTAVNGGPPPTAQVQQQEQQGAVSSLPQNGVAQPVPGGSSGTGGAGGAAARTGAPVTGGTGTTGGGVSGGSTSRAGTAAGSAPTAARPAGPLAPILLGNVGSYSGPVGSSLAGADTMVQVWAQWTNAHGGIAGHPVQVFTADDGGDPQRSLALVKDMAENKHVIALVANMVPFTIQAQLPYLHQHNIPLIGGENSGTAWTSDSIVFPTGTTINEALQGDYKTAHQRNLTKLGFIYCIESASCTNMHDYTVNGGAARAGETLVYQSQVTITQPDYTAQCLSAQTAGVQVMFLALEANSIMRLGASCSRQNYHPIYIATGIQTTRELEGNPDLEGFFATAQDFPYMLGSTPATAPYQQAVQQYAPTLRLSGATGTAWASGQLLAKVAAGIGAQPTPQDLLNGLWSLHNETLDGLTPPLNYIKNQPSPPVSCYFLIELKGGRWTAPSGGTYAC
ncbi:MAG: branched-chain amino acid transport system substrate-binding protein [Actinomycetota bacterium]|nr:branched-chain amino acid transport system substrate-binding protein [Actinomycetota bacterium]